MLLLYGVVIMILPYSTFALFKAGNLLSAAGAWCIIFWLLICHYYVLPMLRIWSQEIDACLLSGTNANLLTYDARSSFSVMTTWNS